MLYATGPAGLATLVRGSSRRIKIMRFRPANIRLINRRSKLPRLRLALSSENDNNNPTGFAAVDRVTPYQSYLSGRLWAEAFSEVHLERELHHTHFICLSHLAASSLGQGGAGLPDLLYQWIVSVAQLPVWIDKPQSGVWRSGKRVAVSTSPHPMLFAGSHAAGAGGL